MEDRRGPDQIPELLWNRNWVIMAKSWLVCLLMFSLMLISCCVKYLTILWYFCEHDGSGEQEDVPAGLAVKLT